MASYAAGGAPGRAGGVARTGGTGGRVDDVFVSAGVIAAVAGARDNCR